MLSTYFSALSEVMAAESRLLAQVYKGHRGKLGENREAVLQRFFSTYLPQRFGVGTGFALLGAEQVSTQQDVVIYDRLNNPVLFPESRAPLFPPSALAAVIEVKSRLTRPKLRKAVEKGVALKRGIRASFAHHPAPPQTEALSCLFAFDAGKLPLAGLLDILADNEEALGAEPVDRLDMLCVLQKGLIFGGGVFYSLSMDGQVLTPHAPPQRQRGMALETEHELLVFYSKLLDHIMSRSDVRPQLMSYLPSETQLGQVVAVR
jgi:uncharacterized protein DUF6602